MRSRCKSALVVLVLASTASQAEITLDVNGGPDIDLVGDLDAPTNFSIEESMGHLSAGGNALFHSFTRFNLARGESARFGASDTVDRILARVTGGTRSEIFGTIDVPNDVDLFFLNPAGILFGPGASLDVQGDVFFSTASRLGLDVAGCARGGGCFDATRTDPNRWTDEGPNSFEFDGLRERAISVVGGDGEGIPDLSVQGDGSLTLIGAGLAINANREPGSSAVPGTLGSESGDLILVSIADSGAVRMDLDLEAFSDTSTFESQGRFELRGGAKIESTRGGNIRIRGGQIAIDNQAMIETRGAEDASAGDVDILGRVISVSDGGVIRSDVSSTVRSRSNAGSLSLAASEKIIVEGDQSAFSGLTSTSHRGRPGDINLNAPEIELRSSTLNNSIVNSNNDNEGASIRLNGLKSVEVESSIVQSNTSGRGGGGSIEIDSPSVNVSRGSRLDASNLLRSLAANGAGRIVVAGDDVVISDGAVLRAQGGGAGGRIQVGSGLGNVEIAGFDTILDVSGLTASTGGTVSGGGQIEILGSSIRIDEARVFAAVPRAADAFIELMADRIRLVDSRIELISSGDGDGAGDVRIHANEKLSMSGEEMLVSNSGSAVEGSSGGNVSIRAARVTLAGGAVSASSRSGSGGNVRIDARELARLIRSEISTSVESGTEAGGNVEIDSLGLIMDGSTIITRANAAGGDISVSAGVFSSRESDFDASSQENLPGRISIVAPASDLPQEMMSTPPEDYDVSRLLFPSCRSVGESVGRLVLSAEDGSYLGPMGLLGIGDFESFER